MNKTTAELIEEYKRLIKIDQPSVYQFARMQEIEEIYYHLMGLPLNISKS